MFLRDAARRCVGGRIGHSQHIESKRLKPIIVGPGTGLAHQSLALPRQPQPEAAIVLVSLKQADEPDQACWRAA